MQNFQIQTFFQSEHVTKNADEDPFLLSGTYAMEGSAKVVVTAVGVSKLNHFLFVWRRLCQ